MAWDVEFHPLFVPEFEALAEVVQDELLAHVTVLEAYGPHLGRPRVDTLHGSRVSNMKELRFDTAGGVWRFAFAFDAARTSSSALSRPSIRTWGTSSVRTPIPAIA